MGWRFRKSFNPLPGIRLNFSPRGISTSVGTGPLRLYLGKQGAAVTAHVPGSGISYRQPIRLPHAEVEHTVQPTPEPIVPEVTTPAPSTATEIHSASTSTLTSDGLEAAKDLLMKAQNERASLIPELRAAEIDAALLRLKHERWTNGWLFRRLFKGTFFRLGEKSAEASDKEAELQEQDRLSRIPTEFDLPDNLTELFGRICDAMAMLSQSHKIWDMLSRAATDRYQERTTASHNVRRTPVAVSLGTCDLIESSWKVPHLMNANGGEIFIYPAFILYHISRDAFALVDIREVSIDYNAASVMEEEAIPADAQVIGQTWKKANKDGSPDKRFASNYQIPIVVYGDIRITSKSGLNEEYLVSNASFAEEFAKAWTTFKDALSPGNA